MLVLRAARLFVEIVAGLAALVVAARMLRIREFTEVVEDIRRRVTGA